MAAKPMLDGVELQQVQEILGHENEVFNQHNVPALEGDFLQDLGRRASRVDLNGILTGPKALPGVETLRTKFRAAAPVSFVADIAAATRIRQMLIEAMSVREIAGKPQRFEYAMSLVEYIAQTPPKTAPARLPAVALPAPPKLNAGALRVEVLAAGKSITDLKQAAVIVEGLRQDGRRLSKTLTNRSGNVWTEDEFPHGQYSVQVALRAQQMFGSAVVALRPAQTTRVIVILHPGATIARAFVVHFSPGKSFIEPPMREVLQQAAAYAYSHPAEKLLVAGHADAAEGTGDGQSLSEQRAHAVWATLALGRSPKALRQVWNAVRSSQSNDRKTGWRTREYQLILQDLGYFHGQIDGEPRLTDSVVRDFQIDHEIQVDGIVGGDTWDALLEAYLDQKPLSIPDHRFLSTAWLGCGNRSLLKNTRDAWRPNRRAEVLFVERGAHLSDLSNWVILPAESGSIEVRGSIRLDDGTPLSGLQYTLIAADGECMNGEQTGGPERGRPIPGRTAWDGSFCYPEQPKGVGIYALEVVGPLVARLAGEPRSQAKGTQVMKRLDGSSDFDVTVSRR